jgi:hypothetical protein
MSTVFASPGTGADVYVFSGDHCPPHVHARHRGEGWIARVGFSYLDEATVLLSIAPTKRAPRRSVVNRLLDDVRERLGECRRMWWTIQLTTCLANQWIVRGADGGLEVCTARTKGARQVAEATYEPASGELAVRFHDGASVRVKQ